MSRSEETFAITFDPAIDGFDPPQFSIEGEDGRGYFPKVKVPVSFSAPNSADFTNPIVSLVDTGSQFCLFPKSVAKEAGIRLSSTKFVATADGRPVPAGFGPGRMKLGAKLPALEVPAIGFHDLGSDLCIVGIQFLLQNFQVHFDYPNGIVKLSYEGDSD